jgi:predicted ABC-class ATPase
MPTISLLVLTLLLTASTLRPPQQAVETISIDGAKNPEQVPQWAVWASSFRFIALGGEAHGDEGIPTQIYRVLTKPDRAVLLQDALAAVKAQKQCAGRVLTLTAENPGEKREVLVEKAKEITMDCRRATLKARDELLEKLPPDGQIAVRTFVESQKRGMTFIVLKAELAQFRLPE